uniref:Uncharacterized protein n=1 Tax=uncultured Alphaproteobacteria bacterium TaxID=91750 RepID=A0A6G8F2H2_9PROT|nr:hypothetical protein PlAlph_4070 [uncultured Alphaproteobacteria bacterium]
MKKTVTFSILAIIGEVALFGWASNICIATYVAVLGIIIAWFAISCKRDIQKQRNAWKANPIPPDIEQFDQFFWQQLISQQNWYLENIYTKDDIKSLIGQYADKIQRTWEDQTIHLQKRMETVKLYMQRINSLTYYLDYIEPKCCIF